MSQPVSVAAWTAFLYVAFFSMFLGFFAWNRGMVLGGVARVGQVQLLQPFVTLAGAAALLGETVGLLEVGFAMLVVALVALRCGCDACGVSCRSEAMNLGSHANEHRPATRSSSAAMDAPAASH